MRSYEISKWIREKLCFGRMRNISHGGAREGGGGPSDLT